MRSTDFCRRCKNLCCAFEKKFFKDGALIINEEEKELFSESDLVEEGPGIYSVIVDRVCPFVNLSQPQLGCTIHEKRPMDCRMYPFHILPQVQLFYFDLACEQIQKIVLALEKPDPELVREVMEIEKFMRKHDEYVVPYLAHIRRFPSELRMKWHRWEKIKRKVAANKR